MGSVLLAHEIIDNRIKVVVLPLHSSLELRSFCILRCAGVGLDQDFSKIVSPLVDEWQKLGSKTECKGFVYSPEAICYLVHGKGHLCHVRKCLVSQIPDAMVRVMHQVVERRSRVIQSKYEVDHGAFYRA